jgi:hypothetical protein
VRRADQSSAWRSRQPAGCSITTVASPAFAALMVLWGCQSRPASVAVRAPAQCPPPPSHEIRVSADSISYLPLFSTTLATLRQQCPAAFDTTIVSLHGDEYAAVTFVLLDVSLVAVRDPRLGDQGVPAYWMILRPQTHLAMRGLKVPTPITSSVPSHHEGPRDVGDRVGLQALRAGEVVRRAFLLPTPRTPARVILPLDVPLSAKWNELRSVYGLPRGTTEPGELVVGFCGLPRFRFVLDVEPWIVGSPEVTGDLTRVPADATINRVLIDPPHRRAPTGTCAPAL